MIWSWCWCTHKQDYRGEFNGGSPAGAGTHGDVVPREAARDTPGTWHGWVGMRDGHSRRGHSRDPILLCLLLPLQVFWSENHFIMSSSSEFLLRQLVGVPVEPPLERRVLSYLDMKLSIGMAEFLSPVGRSPGGNRTGEKRQRQEC